MRNKVEMLALLKHAIGYFEDATRDLETLLESLSEDDLEGLSADLDMVYDKLTLKRLEGLSADLDMVYDKLTLKRAENALSTGLRFYERFKKSGDA